MLKKIKVAVIGGGFSNERDISIKTGENIFNNLSDKKYDKFLIEITKDGKWLLIKDKLLITTDREVDISKSDIKKFDVIFLALHGKFGEDGKIQTMLDILEVPYTGSGALASALAMDKFKTMKFVRNFGIITPNFLYLSDKDNIKLEDIDKIILKKINYPCIVKPNESGSSIGISIVKSFNGLEEAIDKAYNEDTQILIEEFIKGREFSCGVIGNSNDMKLKELPLVEIITDNAIFDYDAKYNSKKTQEICPANISDVLIKEVQALAKKVHEIISCDGLTRSDFILKDNKFYFLEINTLPGLMEESILPKELTVAGITFTEFLDKQINLAIMKYKLKK